jgi:hypothetical protein
MNTQMYQSQLMHHYDTLKEIYKQKGHELVDGQCYSNIKAVYDVEDDELIFYDSILLIQDLSINK